MKPNDSPIYPSLGACSRIGLGVGVSAALLYAGLFALYAVLRSTVAIVSSGDIDAGMIRTISGSGISLLVATVSLTVVALLPSALLGLLTALGTYAFLRTPRLRSIPHAGITGGTVTTVLLIALIAVAGADLAHGAIIRNSPETWWFWVGIPGLVWLLAGAIIGRRISDATDTQTRTISTSRNNGSVHTSSRHAPVEWLR
jgi:hypothetical protein